MGELDGKVPLCYRTSSNVREYNTMARNTGCATTMSLDGDTRKGLAKIMKLSSAPRNNTAVIRGMVQKYLRYLLLQEEVEGADGELVLQAVNTGGEKEFPNRVLDLRL